MLDAKVRLHKKLIEELNLPALERMPVEERLLQRAQAAAVPKICAERVDELMRACAANGVYRSNPLERIFRDMHVARGHIANNTDHFARLHGAVMLGLENNDPFV